MAKERQILICREVFEREIKVNREEEEPEERQILISREITERPILITRENVVIGDVDLSEYPKRTELATVAFSGEYADLNNEPQNFTDDEWELLWGF